MNYALNILLLILTLVSCKNQSNSELNKAKLKAENVLIENKELKQVEKLKIIPNDLQKLGVFDFFDSDEILRVWRFPEGGAVFEELIEIKRNGNEWNSIRYTYLLDEFSNKTEFQSLRKKQVLNLKPKEILEFTNKKLLLKNIKLTDENRVYLSDMYIAEYRYDNQEKYFEFYLSEQGNKNPTKINLIKFLNKIMNE